MKIVPLKERVLVKVKEAKAETKTAGGIYIPDTAKDEKILEGEVVSVGKIEGVQLNPGDNVIYDSYAGTEIKLDGVKHVILDAKNILAKIE